MKTLDVDLRTRAIRGFLIWIEGKHWELEYKGPGDQYQEPEDLVLEYIRALGLAETTYLETQLATMSQRRTDAVSDLGTSMGQDRDPLRPDR